MPLALKHGSMHNVCIEIVTGVFRVLRFHQYAYNYEHCSH